MRETVPVGCAGRDDCALVLSELAANAVEHGGGGDVGVTLVHGDEGLVLIVAHDDPAESEIGVGDENVGELALLTHLSRAEAGVLVPVLLERGRGLLVVGVLSDHATKITRTGAHTVTRVRLASCGCAPEH